MSPLETRTLRISLLSLDICNQRNLFQKKLDIFSVRSILQLTNFNHFCSELITRHQEGYTPLDAATWMGHPEAWQSSACDFGSFSTHFDTELIQNGSKKHLLRSCAEKGGHAKGVMSLKSDPSCLA